MTILSNKNTRCMFNAKLITVAEAKPVKCEKEIPQ